MRALGNLLWHIPFLGFVSAFGVFLFGLLATATVVGAPLGAGLFEIARFYLTPFGQTLIDGRKLNSALSQNLGWRAWGWVIMVIWLPMGVVLAVGLALQAVLCCLTIIGIPAGAAAAKSIGAVFNPVGKKCVSSALAAELERRTAAQQVERALG